MRISQAQVHELFTYLPYAGVLYKTASKRKKPITARYVHVTIDGKIHNVTTATIIWLYMGGNPDHYVQRIDNIKQKGKPRPTLTYTNNLWSNFK